MIRYLFYLVVFLLGLAASAVWLGEMRHLRQAVPGPLPIWSAAVEDSARLPDGAAQLSPVGREPIRLSWALAGLGADGLRWRLTMSGDGIEARADLVLPYWPQRVRLKDGRGTLSVGDTLYPIARIEGDLPALDATPGLIEIEMADGAPPPDFLTDLGATVEIDGPIIRIRVAMP